MIKSFKLFNLFKKKDPIQKICNELGIKNFEIVEDLVNVNGNVSLTYRNLGMSGFEKLPIKFGEVTGNFMLNHTDLKSLEGSPRKVGGDFLCKGHDIPTLEGAPEIIGGDFLFVDNGLMSLEGAPRKVGGDFNFGSDIQRYSRVGKNNITSFKGIPENSINVNKFFNCYDNPVHEVYQLFNTPECVDLINEFEVIRGEFIIRDRLEEVFHTLGMEIQPVPDRTQNRHRHFSRELRFKKYKLV